MKYGFVYRMEWSDISEFSPGHTGQIPVAAVLPDGERVGLDADDLDIAEWNDGKSTAGYVQLHDNVRVRYSYWEDGSMNFGQSGSTMEVLAPKGSKFVFAQRCPFCGDENGEQVVAYDAKAQRHFRANDAPHSICQFERDEQERSIEETYQDEAEYFIR